MVLLAVQLNGSSWWRLLLSCSLLLVAGLCKETGFTFFGLLVVSELLHLMRQRSARRWRRILLLLLVGSVACGVRVWYTAGTRIARMDPHSNPIAAAEDATVRALSYALVHGMLLGSDFQVLFSASIDEDSIDFTWLRF